MMASRESKEIDSDSYSDAEYSDEEREIEDKKPQSKRKRGTKTRTIPPRPVASEGAHAPHTIIPLTSCLFRTVVSNQHALRKWLSAPLTMPTIFFQVCDVREIKDDLLGFSGLKIFGKNASNSVFVSARFGCDIEAGIHEDGTPVNVNALCLAVNNKQLDKALKAAIKAKGLVICAFACARFHNDLSFLFSDPCSTFPSQRRMMLLNFILNTRTPTRVSCSQCRSSTRNPTRACPILSLTRHIPSQCHHAFLARYAQVQKCSGSFVYRVYRTRSFHGG